MHYFIPNHHGRTRNRRASILAAATVLLLVAVVAGPLLAAATSWASCNLIPGTRLSFQGVSGTTNRPFAGPGEHLEIEVGSVADYFVSVVYKPGVTTATHHVLVTDVDTIGCSTLCTTPPAGTGYDFSCTVDLVTAPVAGATRCVELDNSGLEIVTRAGTPFVSFKFPEPENSGLFAAAVAGPVAVAVTTPAAALPDLSVSDCASASGTVACVDSISGDDAFSHLVALPLPNDFSAECVGETPPCAPSVSSIGVAFDDVGNALVPWNWTRILVSHVGRPIPRLVTAEMKLPFAIPSTDYIASYAPEGGRLAPIFEPQFDPTAPVGTVNLFGSADAPYTILRIARGGAGIVATGAGSCLAPIYDPALAFPGSSAGHIAMPNDGVSGCAGALPRVCELGAGIPVSLQAAAETATLRAHLVDESIDSKVRNADADTIDFTILLQDRRNGEFRGLGTPSECSGTLTPGADARAPQMIAEPIFIDPTNPPTAPIEWGGVAAEGKLLAAIESEANETCDINGVGGMSDAVLRAYELGAGPTATELTLPAVCDVTSTAAMAVDDQPVIDEKAVAVSGGRIFFRGYGSGVTGVGPITLQSFEPYSCVVDDLGEADAVSVSAGGAALLSPPVVSGAWELQHYSAAGGVASLGRRAITTSLSGRWLAALVSEAADATDDNGDGDMTDSVARVYDTASASSGFGVVAQAASEVRISGDYVLMKTSETDEAATDLNGDGDTIDQVFEAFTADCSSGPEAACSALTPKHAVDLFNSGSKMMTKCGLVHLVAFSVPEAKDGGVDLNSDGDTNDVVMHVANLLSGTARNLERSVVPCTIVECDPRDPFQVSGATVVFLSSETDEGRDLSGDGLISGVVVNTYDYCEDALRTNGAIPDAYFNDSCGSDPQRLPGGIGSIERQAGEEVVASRNVILVGEAGRCALGGVCGPGSPCPAGALCDEGECCPLTNRCLEYPDVICSTDADCGRCILQYPGACRVDACGQDLDCPVGSTCTRTTVVSVERADADGQVPSLGDSTFDVPPSCMGESFNCLTGQGDIDSKCARAMSKGFAKAVRIADKLVARCHKKRARGDETLADANCNDSDTFDPKGTVAKAKTKLETAADKHCQGVDLTNANVMCPTPCGGVLGPADPILTGEDVALCLGCIAENYVESRGAAMLGSPRLPLQSPELERCHQTVSKAYGKMLGAVLKDKTKCNGGTGECAVNLLEGKVAKAKSKAEARLADKCSTLDLTALDSCSGSLPGLYDCLAKHSIPCGDSPWCLTACVDLAPTTTTTTTLCSTTTTTTLPERIAFVTSQVFDGDLGGIAAADAQCQSLAAGAGLPGSYQAWLCDGALAPADRLPVFNGDYVRTDGQLVASNSADLMNGLLTNPINVDENGNDLSSHPVAAAWSYVASDGTCSVVTYPSPGGGPCPPATSCSSLCANNPMVSGGGWTTMDTQAQGLIGNINSTTGNWTDANQFACDNLARIYCIGF